MGHAGPALEKACETEKQPRYANRKILSALALSLSLAVGGCTDQPQDPNCPVQGVAEYPGEPGFEEPRDALTWALMTQRVLLTGPGDEDEYQQIRRSPEWIDFEYRVDGEVHHVWEVILQDGKWAVGGRSGCMPPERPPVP